MNHVTDFFNPFARRDEIMATLRAESGGRFAIVHKALRETCDAGGHCDLDRVVTHIRAQKQGHHPPAP